MMRALTLEEFLGHRPTRASELLDDPDGGEARAWQAAIRIGAASRGFLAGEMMSESEYLGYEPGDQ